MKTMITSKIINGFTLCIMLIGASITAQHTKYPGAFLSSDEIDNAVASTTGYSYIDPELTNIDQLTLNPTATIGLEVDSNKPPYATFSYAVDLQVFPVSQDGSEGTPTEITLSVTHNVTTSGEFVDKTVHVLEGFYGVRVVIVKKTYTDLDTNATSNSTPDNISMHLGFETERYYKLSDVLPVFIENPNKITTYTDNFGNTVQESLNLNWENVKGAVTYELEWTWVDRYGDTKNDLSANEIALTEKEFKGNSSRIQTNKTHYQIPLIYDKGFLIYRVRAVGKSMDPKYISKRLYGSWSSGKDAETVADWNTYIETTGHENQKNWQFQASYAEEGKKKEVVSYFDGTLRNRQTVTKINSDNHAIVGEVIYDNQGRPAVEVLPVPVTESGIKYRDNFNQNSVGEIYTHNDFDWDDPNKEDEVSVSDMTSTAGASKYYSANNDITNEFRDRIPNAKQFPFSQIEYTSDNTGRVHRKGGVGPQYQLGSGHEMKYNYGLPTQEELNRLFGYKVGDYKHYKKNLVIDPNGQVSISYIDPQGRTIATALTGGDPENLDALDEEQSGNHGSMTANLLAGIINDSKETSFYLNKQILVDGNKGDEGPKDYTFNYGLDATTYSDCADNTYAFVYDLELSLKNDQGEDMFTPVIKTIGDDGIQPIVDFSELIDNVSLDIGAYILHKELKVNEQVLISYTQDFMKSLTDPENPACYLDPIVFAPQATLTECFVSCEDCVTSLDTKEAYILTQLGAYFNNDSFIADGTNGDYIAVSWEDQEDDTNGALLIDQETVNALIVRYDREWELLVKACMEPCDTLIDACEGKRKILLADMSPGGQYGSLASISGSDELSDPLSIFNDAGFLTAPNSNRRVDWRSAEYKDEFGNPAEIEVKRQNDGSYKPEVYNESNVKLGYNDQGEATYIWVAPENLANLEDFLNRWQDSWAEALLSYHPEYGYLQYSEEVCTTVNDVEVYDPKTKEKTFQSLDAGEYDAYLQTIDTYEDAIAAGMLKNATEIYTKDPFSIQLGEGFENSTLTNWKNSVMNRALIIQYEAAKQEDGSGIPMLEFAYRNVVCNGLTKCAVNFNPTSTINNLPNKWQQDEIWIGYKNYYLSLKQKLRYVLMGVQMKKTGNYNGCIGQDGEQILSSVLRNYTAIAEEIYVYETTNTNNTPCNSNASKAYKDKQKRFVPIDVNYDAGIDEVDNIEDLENNGDFQTYLQTGRCPLSFDLESMLNGMVNETDANGKKKSVEGTRGYTGRYIVPSLYEAFGGVLGDGDAIDLSGNVQNQGASLITQIDVTRGIASTICANALTLQLPSSGWDTSYTWYDYTPNGTINGWEILSFSNLFYDSDNSDPTSSVYGFKVLATVRVGANTIEVIFTGTTCAAIGECGLNNDGIGDVLDDTNGGLYSDCNKKYLFKEGLKSVLNDIIDNNQVDNTAYTITELAIYKDSYLPEFFFGENVTNAITWSANLNRYTLQSSAGTEVSINLSQELSSLDIKDISGIRIDKRPVLNGEFVADITFYYYTTTGSYQNVTGTITKDGNELLDFSCCRYIEGDDGGGDEFSCGNDASFKPQFAFHMKNLMNALLAKGEFYYPDVDLSEYNEYNTFLQEFFTKSTNKVCDDISSSGGICFSSNYAEASKVTWDGSGILSAIPDSQIVIRHQDSYNTIEFLLSDDGFDGITESLREIEFIDELTFDIYPGEDGNSQMNITYTSDGNRIIEEFGAIGYQVDVGDGDIQFQQLYFGCDLGDGDEDPFDDTLDCENKPTLAPKFTYFFKEFLNALLDDEDFYRDNVSLSSHPEFNTFLQEFFTNNYISLCQSSDCTPIDFSETNTIRWHGASLSEGSGRAFLYNEGERVASIVLGNWNSNTHHESLKNIESIISVESGDIQFANNLTYTYLDTNGEEFTYGNRAVYIEYTKETPPAGLVSSILRFSCGLANIDSQDNPTLLSENNFDVDSNNSPSQNNTPQTCITCIPQPVAPVSCSEQYPVFMDFLDLDADGNSARITDYTLPEFFDEKFFCELNFAYLVDSYISYINTLGITSTDDYAYLSIDEFGSTKLNYGFDRIENVIQAYKIAGGNTEGAPSWITFVNETYLVENQVCPPAPLQPKISMDIDIEIEKDPCTEFNLSVSETYQKDSYDQYLQTKKAQFIRSYTEAAYANAKETFTMTYYDKEYHYTLYYYDQAGNLIQTVPPEGIDRLDNAAHEEINYLRVNEPNYTLATGRNNEKVLPEHRLQTEYKYNSLNQLIWQQTPDGGITRFAYDKLGRIIASQNARQVAKNGTERFSYSTYDDLGRIVEAGEIWLPEGTYTITEKGRLQKTGNTGYQDGFEKTDRNDLREVTVSQYDYTDNDGIQYFKTNYDPYNSRNRVAMSLYFDTYNEATALSTYDNGCYYNYDVHGNVKELMMIIPDMAINNFAQGVKNTIYEYDLISGNVHSVTYQKDQPDQFIHRYSYDADNRITAVETSTDGVIWEKDASYLYYAHGPIARMIVGDKEVQGIDYAYTLQGWIKGVNSESLTPDTDMGKDGATGSAVAKDAFGYSLGYHKGDYISVGNTATNAFAHSNNVALQTNRNLYNGNIKQMVTSLIDTDETALAPQINHYTYDQLNRITSMNGYTDQGTSNYNSAYTYDRNGNLQSLQRSAKNANGQMVEMDNLSYNYNVDAEDNKVNNQLRSVYETVGLDANFDTDLDSGQQQDNYVYDEIGQLLRDKQEGLTIEWRNDAKVKSVTKDDGTVITFAYDPTGNRISKTTTRNNVASTTYYERDAQGHVLSTYTKEDKNGTKSLTLNEQHIYGSNRLGIQENSLDLLANTQNLTPNTYNRQVGDKRFELSNHLGNVLSVTTDRKLAVGNVFTPDVVAYNDYYPFGMLLPNRQGNSAEYRYGFNGKEKDDDWKGEGVQYDYGFRVYDARIAKFLSVDPLAPSYPWYTPYQFAGNMPIEAIDLDGLEPQFVNGVFTGQYKVKEGQGPTQIAKDMAGYGINVDWMDITYSNQQYFDHIPAPEFVKTSPKFKKLNMNPGDTVIIPITNDTNSKTTNNDSGNKSSFISDGINALGVMGNVGNETYYSKNFNTWMDKKGNLRSQKWGGNGSMGGKHKFARARAKGLGLLNYGAGAYNLYSINEDYENGIIDDRTKNLLHYQNAVGTISPPLISIPMTVGGKIGEENASEIEKMVIWLSIHLGPFKEEGFNKNEKQNKVDEDESTSR
ncbi:RHS repeat-associated core domain-containing protein [Aquimarina sp. MMG016]|uniref:RHS repeat-associated core domain-containing protein n=1 Tax=Aquimarina sp. MMG016 TaxID=2822690 RepID=UPI001B39FD4C|nr:RHS repeat-associated core domain-containing protein [Aquimarina sp. MMG016]MBQ4819864.1 hypothetical protein [Aquimarina sp. MMG016]